MLYRHSSILEAAVVDIPDKVWGEEVMASVVLNKGTKLTEEEIIECCKERLADFKCPRKIEFARPLSKKATGKIQKNKIVEHYLGMG